MKKLILMVVMAVAMLVGCGNKPEPVTEAEVVGYWMDNEEQVYTIHEGGMVTIAAPMKLGDEVAGYMNMPIGMITYGDEVKIAWSFEEGLVTVCTFSEDRNSFEMTVDGETAKMTRLTKEQAAEMGVDVDEE